MISRPAGRAVAEAVEGPEDGERDCADYYEGYYSSQEQTPVAGADEFCEDEQGEDREYEEAGELCDHGQASCQAD